MLPRRSATKVVSGDNYGEFSFELTRFDEAGGVGGRGKANERIGAELLVLVRVGGDEGEVLGGDDLVSVDVVSDDITEAVEGGGWGGGVGGCFGGG